MKKRHIAVLLLVMLMSNLAFAGWAVAEDTSGDTTTEKTEKTQAEQAAEAKPETFNTGWDPVWSILEVETDEDIVVGQEFNIKVTARNIGSGVAMYPIVTFTEEEDRKEMTHFGVIGNTDNVYHSNIERVESGETKVFDIRMKVSADTKELPEGSAYNLNLTLKSKNWQVDKPEAFGATTTIVLKPSYTLSEPTFVVDSVTFDPAIADGVKKTTATLNISNISDSKARNVSVSLSGIAISEKNTDQNIKVTDLSNTKRVGDVAGKQKITVSYDLELNDARRNNQMKMTINYNGLEKPVEETINMPLPERGSSASNTKPKVIINKYVVDPSKVLAGNTVTLRLYVENTHPEEVQNISMTLKVPTSESNSATGTTVSGGTVFSPVNSSNTFYIDAIAGKSTVMKEISLYVDPNAQAKTYVVPVDFTYESDAVEGEDLTGTDNINIPVTQESQVEIINASLPTFGNVGMPVDFSVEFVNTGKVALTNFKASLEGESIPDAESSVYYVGNFDAAASDTFSSSFFPQEEGTVTGNVVLSYRDADNQEVRLEQPFTVEVGPAVEMPPMDMNNMEPPEESFFSKIKSHIVTIVLVAIIIVLAGVIIRDKRKAKADEELLNG